MLICLHVECIWRCCQCHRCEVDINSHCMKWSFLYQRHIIFGLRLMLHVCSVIEPVIDWFKCEVIYSDLTLNSLRYVIYCERIQLLLASVYIYVCPVLSYRAVIWCWIFGFLLYSYSSNFLYAVKWTVLWYLCCGKMCADQELISYRWLSYYSFSACSRCWLGRHSSRKPKVPSFQIGGGCNLTGLFFK